MPRNHQVNDIFQEFEVEAVLDRRVVLLDNRCTKVQYFFKYVGNSTKFYLSLCSMAAAVNEAGPADGSHSKGEPDGDALLYCEALLSSEASLSDDADPAESAGPTAEESGSSAESAGLPAEESGPSVESAGPPAKESV
ncbi:hypothetical protein OUZ56_029774 [Daphnia magna]|uniref:Uncharacterized protein n=1 Tax=Daphnia magna TaxID=35525 RepID=A0ABR0B7T1_9CRUS|nr:hypothetical protein OUZ56_029774 [Daphnia magna]